MKGAAYSLFLGLAVLALFAHIGLLFRMIAAVAKALPHEKRFPSIDYRYNYPEVIRLHKDFFPSSVLRVAWRLSAVAAPLLVATAITLYYQGAE